MVGMFAKTTNNTNKSDIRRKSALIVRSDDNNNKYKPNLKSKHSRSDAITELELIYDKLNEELLDSDLLDRAERRDLPFSHQLIWTSGQTDHKNRNNDYNDVNNNDITHDLRVKPFVCNNNNNNNNSSYESFNKRRSMATIEALEALRNDYKCLDSGLRAEQWTVRSRTPPYRRSAIPDIVRDDFAFRKYNKSLSHSQLCPNESIKGFNSIKRINNNKHYSMSYLLTTSSEDDINEQNDSNNGIYTNDTDLKYLSKANIKVDDLSNRRIRQSSANNWQPPHPPFGIPNTIVSHSSANDYIRAELDPKELSKVRFRSKYSVPHLIHDDMAFRSLRKNHKSPLPLPLPINSSMPNISVPISSSRV